MKTKQVNPMSAFVDSSFDCEFSQAFGFHKIYIGKLKSVEEFAGVGNFVYWLCDDLNSISGIAMCRPRLNNPQVLPDWGWLENPLLGGVVWEARYSNYKACSTAAFTNRPIMSSDLVRMIKDDNYIIEWVSCIGVQQGSQLEEWAKANDVPIYNNDMEVVK